MSALTWGLVLLSYAIGAAKLQQGRCSHCQRAGVRSSVILEGATSCTAMHCGSGHYVFACEEQCRIVDKVNPVGPSHRSRTVPRMTWEDCPLCQAEVNEAMAKQDRLADLKDRHDADAFDREYDR